MRCTNSSLFPGRKHYKCAKICGDTSGNYHPHGEAVIYPTLVHMAQPWAMRERLVDGKGNFGSIEDDPPAAMRYTEARLTHLGAALMQDMDKDTVDFVPNYDERMHRADGFSRRRFRICSSTAARASPSAWPRTCAPHNLGEVMDGICAQIDKPDDHDSGVDEVHQRPGLSDRRHDLRRRGHQELFHDRQGQHQVARARRGRRR